MDPEPTNVDHTLWITRQWAAVVREEADGRISHEQAFDAVWELSHMLHAGVFCSFYSSPEEAKKSADLHFVRGK